MSLRRRIPLTALSLHNQNVQALALAKATAAMATPLVAEPAYRHIPVKALSPTQPRARITQILRQVIFLTAWLALAHHLQ